MRSDMTNVDLPSQLQDLSYSHTDAVNAKFIAENKPYFDKLQLTSWFNQSSLAGTSANKNFDPTNSNGNFSPFPDNSAYKIPLNGSNYSTGARGATTWGDADSAQFTLGLDTTVIRQTFLGTQSNFKPPTTPTPQFGPLGVPRTTQVDAGTFADANVKLTERITLNAGGRYDYVASQDASMDFFVPGAPGTPISSPNSGLHNVYHLGSAFINSDYKVDDHWTASAGFGVSQLAPTPSQLYSNFSFLTDLTQANDFDNYLGGNPNLKKQTANQVDVGLRGKYSKLRCEWHGYYSYVADFATIATDPAVSVTGIHYVNHNTILAGTELYSEYDISSRLTGFGSVAYQYGQDLAIDAPLWGMYPLVGNAGFRLHDPSEDHRWNLEWVTQMVDAQNRISPMGTLGPPPGPLTYQGGIGGEIRTPGYTINNLRGNYALNRHVNLTAGVTNLGNRLYRTAYDGQYNYNSPSTVPLGMGTLHGMNPINQPGASGYFVLEVKY